MIQYRSGAWFSKKTLIILLWTLSSSAAITVYSKNLHDKTLLIFNLVSTVVIVPVAGLLADVYLSRYKVVSYSLRLLFVSSYLFLLSHIAWCWSLESTLTRHCSKVYKE